MFKQSSTIQAIVCDNLYQNKQNDTHLTDSNLGKKATEIQKHSGFQRGKR